MDYANQDCPVFLIHDVVCEDLDGWLAQCYGYLFEEVLEQWYVDEKLWPQDRTLELFTAWCEMEVHEVIIDIADEPLRDTDYENILRQAWPTPGHLGAASPAQSFG